MHPFQGYIFFLLLTLVPRLGHHNLAFSKSTHLIGATFLVKIFPLNFSLDFHLTY